MKTQTIPNKEEAKQVASSTLEQIFVTAPELKISVKHISYDEDATIQIRFKTPKGANHVSVIYDYGADLYNVEIHECRILTKDPYMINRKINTHTGIYNDKLVSIIKKELGI